MACSQTYIPKMMRCAAMAPRKTEVEEAGKEQRKKKKQTKKMKRRLQNQMVVQQFE